MALLVGRATAVRHSGNPLADWVFRRFVEVLSSERVRIVRKKRLVNPDDPHRRTIRGLMDPDSFPVGSRVQIFINSARSTHRTRNEELETLLHELSHIVWPHAREREILQMENILARQFTGHQRNALKAFLPRHEVKNYPRPRGIAMA